MYCWICQKLNGSPPHVTVMQMRQWAFWEKNGQKKRKTTLFSLDETSLLGQQTNHLQFLVWMLHIGRGPTSWLKVFPPGQLELVNVGGWLTSGSCFGLAVQHRLIPFWKVYLPSAAASVCLVSSLRGSGCWWSCWGWGRQPTSFFSFLCHS